MQTTSAGRGLAWTLLIASGVANIAGYAFDLYGRFWWFDRLLHAFTILAVTFWLAVFPFRAALDRRRGGAVLVVMLLASVGIAVGALWEVAEWGFDQLAPGNVIKGKNDTLADIVMDTGGAILAAIMALRFMRPS